ncbi:MAG TPA: protein translocase subunit SecF [Acidimicrobiales bacterium]|nr:protein translocase subunit SecF [Acidimicrobiales bacterium]
MSVFKKLASYENDIDFVRLWRIGAAISTVLMVVSIGALAIRGLNLGIDFEGGTSWEVEAPDASVSDTRDALPASAQGAKIQVIGADVVRVQAEPADEEEVRAVTESLAELAGVDRTAVSVSTVGPTWGDEISSKAQRALVWFFLIVAAYMAIRLEWKMAVGALVAVVHDIVFTVGFYALFQLEVTPATVIAILTIMGYSLYDTVVVFDKAHDNAARPGTAQRMTYTDLMSLSMNQVLMRSLNATITSLLPVLSMLVIGSFILGAVTLEEFAVALAVGLVIGAYSSIFVAAPVVAWLKEREPHWRSLRNRLATQEARQSGQPVPVAAAAPGGTRGTSAAGAPPLSGRAIPPRPRKKGKRR